MFLCVNDCGSFYYGFLRSHGPCEECGKVADCWEVPPWAWKAEDARRGQERASKCVALGTYPCPGCGKVEHIELCTCGRMAELYALVRHDTDIKALLAGMEG